jgi:hypothetical protein
VLSLPLFVSSGVPFVFIHTVVLIQVFQCQSRQVSAIRAAVAANLIEIVQA